MRVLLFVVFVLNLPNFASSQDTNWVESSKYIELTERRTLVYHQNGVLAKEYVKKPRAILKTKEWDNSGNLIRISKSVYRSSRKHDFTTYLRIQYHHNGKISRKTFIKMVGCNHIKRRWQKNYDETGKRIY